MGYRGQMEGWHEDDFECFGHCGLCDECMLRHYQLEDEYYDASRNDENQNHRSEYYG